MIKLITRLVFIAIAAVLTLAFLKPNTFKVERSISIHAPAEKVFGILNDFHHWQEWSPWEQLDPNMERTHSGAASGKGAVYAWKGNKQVGAGRMEIVDAIAPTKLNIQLDFLEPFKAHNMAEYTLTPEGDNTKVTWVMSGPSPFMTKVMQVFMSMDKMVGKDFERGLAQLKTLAEK